MPHNTVSANVVDRDWQVAQDRVLLYLRTLEVPAHEALEFALEALRRAENRPCQTTPGDYPAARRAMHALRELLREQGLAPSVSPPRQPSGDGKTSFAGVRAMPPLHRGSMVVEEIAQRHWVAFLRRCAQQPAAAAWYSVSTRFFYLILALAFLIIVIIAILNV